MLLVHIYIYIYVCVYRLTERPSHFEGSDVLFDALVLTSIAALYQQRLWIQMISARFGPAVHGQPWGAAAKTR